MGNLNMSQQGWVETQFRKGWRAVRINGQRAFEDSTGWSMPLIHSLVHEDLWKGLRVYAISATWKERHAKGVPVKFTDSELRKAKPAVEDTQHVYGKEGEYPGVACWDLNEPDYWPHLFATFCNFRYKPEWLEKKGQTNN